MRWKLFAKLDAHSTVQVDPGSTPLATNTPFDSHETRKSSAKTPIPANTKPTHTAFHIFMFQLPMVY